LVDFVISGVRFFNIIVGVTVAHSMKTNAYDSHIRLFKAGAAAAVAAAAVAAAAAAATAATVGDSRRRSSSGAPPVGGHSCDTGSSLILFDE
jgi:uncharacterized membrane protein